MNDNLRMYRYELGALATAAGGDRKVSYTELSKLFNKYVASEAWEFATVLKLSDYLEAAKKYDAEGNYTERDEAVMAFIKRSMVK